MAKYFTMSEMTYSSEANKYDIDNTPSEEIKEHLEELMEVLDTLREKWGTAIKVTSGYRCPELNKKIGGSKTSVHMLGYGADLKPFNNKLDKFFECAREWAKDNDFDQIIEETSSNGGRWLHIGLYNNKGQQRREVKKLKQK